MIHAAHRAVLWCFARLPRRLRRRIVRIGAPTFTVGSLCSIEHGSKIVLVKLRYRSGWGLPGGLLQRGEAPADAARREVLEEIGLRVRLEDGPAYVIDPRARRIDVVYRATPVGDARSTGWGSGAIEPRSAEVLEAAWFPLDDLPRLQTEATSARAALAALEERGAVAPKDGTSLDR